MALRDWLPGRRDTVVTTDAAQPVAAGIGVDDAPMVEQPSVSAYAELGATGLKRMGGYVFEEIERALVGIRGVRVFKEMRDNDPVVGAFLFAIEMLIRSVSWDVKAASASNEDLRRRDYVKSCMNDMSMSWTDTIVENLSMAPFGWCVPPEQRVLNGIGVPVLAGSIKVGDEVLSAKGRARRVLHVFRRRHVGKLLKIKLRGYPHPIEMTENHRLPTIDGWTEAGKLAVGDTLLRPRLKLQLGGDYRTGWLVGLYLAEGSREVGRTRVTFSVHRKEVDEVADELEKWIVEQGLQSHHWLAKLKPIRFQCPPNGGRVIFSHPKLRELIDEWVGGNDAWSKHLLKLPTHEEFARGVVDGWLYGDGHVATDKNGYPVANAVTVSEALAQQMQLVAGSVGLPSPLDYRVNEGYASDFGPMPNCYKLGLLPGVRVVYKRTAGLETEVRQLRAAGNSMQAIAESVGVSYTTVWKWLHSDGPKHHGRQCQVFQTAIGHPITSIEARDYDGEVIDYEVDSDHTFCAGVASVSNSWHEVVYKLRNGQQPEGSELGSSRYDDGMIGWRKMPIRSQDSLLRWEFDPAGGVRAMYQQAPPDYQLRRIPIEKSLLFRTTMHKNDPQGRSVLRNAFVPYYFKKNVMRYEAIGVERDLAGLPVLEVPPRLLSTKATSEEKQLLAVYQKIVTNVRRDEQEGLILPRQYDANGRELYKFSLLSTGGRRQHDTGAIIGRYNQEIAVTVLADFLLVGHGSQGSGGGKGGTALVKNKTEIFALSITALLDAIASVYNRYEIPRLFRLNGIALDALPEVTHGKIEEVDLTELGAYVTALSGAAMPLFPDDKLENYLRSAGDLPEKTEASTADASGAEAEAVI